jgi:hypothetical protein
MLLIVNDKNSSAAQDTIVAPQSQWASSQSIARRTGSSRGGTGAVTAWIADHCASIRFRASSGGDGRSAPLFKCEIAPSAGAVRHVATAALLL